MLFKNLKSWIGRFLLILAIVGGGLGVFSASATSAYAADGWTNVGPAGFSESGTDYITLAFNGDTPYVAYSDGSNGYRVTVMKYNGNGWEVVGTPGFSANEGRYISLAFNDGTPYVAYQESGYQESGYHYIWAATVMKYNGSTWEVVGTPGFSAWVAYYMSITFNDGIPYVSYQDGGNGFKATLMKYNGSDWEPVGTPGFSAGMADYISLAFNGGTPYVAFMDDHGSKGTVMKFNGSSWEVVGTRAFADGCWHLVFNADIPYVACSYSSAESRLMKYNGNSWETVGTPGFANIAAGSISLAFSDGMPYVAYNDGANAGKVTVKKYNGSSWEVVGTPGFSTGKTTYGYLSFVINGATPYVAYADDENGKKATVMKYVDTTAPILNSFTRQLPISSPTDADTLIFRATFDESVMNVNSDDFDVSGTTTAIVTDVSTVNTHTYDITVSGGNLDSFRGEVGLNLTSGQDIEDHAGNTLLVNEPTTDETYILDNPPVVSSVVRTDENFTSAPFVNFKVTFSRAVTGVDTVTPFSDFNLVTNGATGAIITSVVDTGDQTSYMVTVGTGSGNGTIRLDIRDTATIHDLAGNPLAGLPYTEGETYNITFTTCAGQTQIPITECDALVALYHSTNGPAWENNTGWLQTTTPCSWRGVACANEGTSVVHLLLVGNQLAGSIPAELGNLTNLTYLDMRFNQLSGSIPPELGNLTGLTTVLLRRNELSGTIPNELGNLSNLKNLNLQANHLSGSIPSELGNLTNLNDLNLEDNQLSGSIPSELSNLINLTSLQMGSNQFSGSIPPQLGQLTDLYVLILSFNQLSGDIPPELGNMVGLNYLYLSDNQLSGTIPPELGNLANLSTLWMNNNQLSGAIPPELGNLTNLHYLNLNDNQLSGSIPNEVGNLTGLQGLQLQGNHFTGEFPTSIINMTDLLHFNYDCWITSTDLAVVTYLEDRSPGWQNKVCPIVSSITRVNSNPTNSSNVSFTVTFSEKVTGVTVNDFVLTQTGVTRASITRVVGSDKAYKVTVNTGSGDGTIRLDVIDNDSIKDVSNNPLGGMGTANGDFNAGEEFSIIKSVPVPAAPVLSSPATGAQLASLQPVLDWKDSIPTAHHYQVQVSTNNAFSALMINESNVLTSTFTPASDLIAGTLYYWRVRAFNVNGVASGWSTVRNFKTPLSRPTLVLPAENVSLVTDRPAFEWEDVSGATSYVLQVSSVSNFSTLLVNATMSGTNYSMTKDLPQKKTLYWRVRAKTSVVNGPWSAKWTFKTGNPPSLPALASPANGVLIKDYTPFFNWSNSTLPTGTTFKYYELQVDDTPDFSSMEINITTTVSQFTPLSDLALNTKFYWRVRAINTVNSVDQVSGWSPVWSFRTVISPP